MKSKKLIALVMALAMLASLLPGCGGGAETPTTEPQQTVQTIPTTAPTEVTEPADTQPPETEATEAPTEPEPVLMELSADERYEINIFLSNFSEQCFREDFIWNEAASNEVFYSAEADIVEIVSFVWLFAKINRSDEEDVSYNGDFYYGIDIDVLDSLAQRFFGRTLTESEISAAKEPGYSVYDGMVCYPAADGDTYTNMTVTDRMYDLGDGTMRAEFAIYSASMDTDEVVGAGGPIHDKSVYYMTGEQIRGRSDFEFHLKGAAVVRPQTLDNGRESYQLVSYELYE